MLIVTRKIKAFKEIKGENINILTNSKNKNSKKFFRYFLDNFAKMSKR